MTFIKDSGSTVIKDYLKRLMEEGKVITFIFLSSFVLWLANIIFDIGKEIKVFIPNGFILYSDTIFLLIIKYCLTAILISAVLSFGLSIFANIYYNKSNWSKELDQRFMTLKRVVSFTLNACFDFSKIAFSILFISLTLGRENILTFLSGLNFFIQLILISFSPLIVWGIIYGLIVGCDVTCRRSLCQTNDKTH